MKEIMKCECCDLEVKNIDDFTQNHQKCIEEWVAHNYKHIYDVSVVPIEVQDGS